MLAQSYDSKGRLQYFTDILILLGLVLVCTGVMSILAFTVCGQLFNLSFMDIMQKIQDAGNAENRNIIKLFNTITTFGTWFLSAFLFVKIRNFRLLSFWKVHKVSFKSIWLMLPFLLLAMLIVSAKLYSWNKLIPFPSFFDSWIATTHKTEALMQSLLVMQSKEELIYNIIIIALCAAIFEEIFFRATLQKLLIGLSGNSHIGIAITALLFTLVHTNILQFIPMLFLAFVLGYIYHWSNSIIPSVILHFCNNALAVLANYYQDKSQLAQQLANDNMTPQWYVALLAASIVVIIFYKIYKANKSLIINE